MLLNIHLCEKTWNVLDLMCISLNKLISAQLGANIVDS
jgi:hypothetical protein